MPDDVDELDRIRYFKNGRPMYYGRQGQPISLRQWADMFGDGPGRTLADDEVGDARVLTMWLGVEDEPFGDDPPLIFGTAIYLGTSFTHEVMSPTEEAALEAHTTAVRELKRERGIPVDDEGES